jgi:hypothetical protein
MEGKCHEIFEKVAKVHNTAHVLAQVWNSWDVKSRPEVRQESIDKIRQRVVELNDKKLVRARDSNDLFTYLDFLEDLNAGKEFVKTKRLSHFSQEDSLVETIDNLTTEMAIHAIADCECTRNLLKPINPNEELQ